MKGPTLVGVRIAETLKNTPITFFEPPTTLRPIKSRYNYRIKCK
jgi:hypothetical protein